MNPDIILSPSPGVVFRRIGEESILVPVRNKVSEGDALFSMNATGAFVWQMIDGKKTLLEIAKLLSRETSESEQVALTDILVFVGDLVEQKLAIQK